MSHAISTSHTSKSEETLPKDGRAEWERPALRRVLPANEAGAKQNGQADVQAAS
jgi:hypothetical protein